MSINFEFLNNSVDPNNQVSFPYYFDGADKKEAKFKLMFIGNSITYHERKDQIGWYKDCGMAASDINHDYVHIIYREIEKKYGPTSLCVFNGGHWEKDFLNESLLDSIVGCTKDFSPDILVIRIGENFNKEYLKDENSVFLAFNSLIKRNKEHAKKVYITSMFWEHPVLDEAILKASQENGATYIKIFDLGAQRKYLAYDQYNNGAIYCGHPGDLGMEAIAERILGAMKL